MLILIRWFVSFATGRRFMLQTVGHPPVLIALASADAEMVFLVVAAEGTCIEYIRDLAFSMMAMSVAWLVMLQYHTE